MTRKPGLKRSIKITQWLWERRGRCGRNQEHLKLRNKVEVISLKKGRPAFKSTRLGKESEGERLETTTTERGRERKKKERYSWKRRAS